MVNRCYNGDSLYLGFLAVAGTIRKFTLPDCLGLRQPQVPFFIHILNYAVNLAYGDLPLVGVYVVPPLDYPDQDVSDVLFYQVAYVPDVFCFS